MKKLLQNRIVKTVFSVTGVIILTKLMGFLKQMYVAASFGATIETDLINLSQGLVSDIEYLLIMSVGTAFISVYIYARTEDEEGAKCFATDTAKVLLLIAAGLVLLVLAFAPFLAHLIAPTYSAELNGQLAKYLRLFMPTLLLSVLISIFESAMEANKRFVPGQLIGFNQSVLMILCVFLLKDILGVQSMVVAYFAFCVFNVFFCGLLSRRYWKFSRGNPLRNPSVRSLARMVVPRLIGFSAIYVNQLVDKILVSGLDAGSVTALGYGAVLSNLISTFIGSFSAILFPYLTEMISHKKDREAATLNDSATLAMVTLFLPVSIVFIVCARDIATVVFGHGAFDERATAITARALIGYSISFVPMVFRGNYSNIHYGYQDSKRPMINSSIGIGVNIVLSILLCPRYGVLGVTLASGFSVAVSGLLNLITARRYNQYLSVSPYFRWAPLLLAAGAVCVLSCLGGNRLLADWRPLLRLLVTGAASVALYALVALPLVLRTVRLFAETRALGQTGEDADGENEENMPEIG